MQIILYFVLLCVCVCVCVSLFISSKNRKEVCLLDSFFFF